MPLGRARYYVLDESRQVVECDVLAWGRLFGSAERVVRQDCVRGALVSTVFLGLDHNWSGRGAPIVFETMVFGDPDYDELQLRYATWDEALASHTLVLNHVREPAWSRWLCRLFSGLIGELGVGIGGTTRSFA